ncbi:MAG: polyprenyl synthetase family protein [Clostridiales Family XIII bacterium]|jgi:geranylgeranyl pyrophosphate synthase|nr:polyprenyl synthetase family protein [Clostridiales Family XIII bacterium]
MSGTGGMIGRSGTGGAFFRAGARRVGDLGAACERVEARLAGMEALFRDRFAAEGGTDMDACVYGALMGGGKRLRPMLLCLAAGFGEPGTRGVTGLMAVVEMIHTASLVHDDIVDGSALRRGRPTINALKGGRFAVQSAYYMIAEALDMLRESGLPGVHGILAGIPMDMCLGELRQLSVEYSVELQTEEDYLGRIERKTARLIEGSCLAGARAAGAGAAQEEALGAYGLALGMLFQLRDDLLDYEGAAEDGKPALQDIRRGIYTLPLLHAAREAFDPRLAALLGKRGKTEGELSEICAWARASGGVSRTKRLMGEYAGRAAAALALLPETGERAMLEEIALLLMGTSRLEEG